MSIAYTIVRKSNLKNTYIKIQRDGSVLVKANPRVTKESINNFITQKTSWIIKKQQEILDAKKRDDCITLLGKSYPLIIQKENRNDFEAIFSNEKFTFKIPLSLDTDTVSKIIDHFYKNKSAEYILPLIKKWSFQMQLYPIKVGFRKTKTRWGSCSSKNSLSFNTHLAKLSMEAIEYVVVHELSHIKHKNHSYEFWSLVKNNLPDYKLREKELKNFYI
jgi:predicted metal-dependent hydrolase